MGGLLDADKRGRLYTPSPGGSLVYYPDMGIAL